MADEKLNTGPGEEKLPEAPAPVTVDEPQAPAPEQTAAPDRKSTRLNSSHASKSRMPSSA